jgi:hypothetical protein
VNDQLRLLAADRGAASVPVDSATILISPKPGIDDSGIKAAEAHVHLVAPPTLIEIAYDVRSAWDDLLAKSYGRTLPELRDLVAEAFRTHGVLPSLLHDRLTRDPVNPTTV